MKPLPQHDLDSVLFQTKSLWPEEGSFCIIGGKGFVGSWMNHTLHHAANQMSLDYFSIPLRLPSKLPPCDYAIVCPRWDVKIDWSNFKAVRKAVLFVSSGAVLERDDEIARKKRKDEDGLKWAADQYGFKAKIARIYATIGPRMPENYGFAAAEFLKNEREKQPMRVFNPDSQRSYLYASDMAVWLWKVLFRGTNSRAYVVGSEEVVTIGQLTEKIWPKGPKLHLPTSEPANRYVPKTIFTRTGLAVRENVNLDEAIRRTKEWQQTP